MQGLCGGWTEPAPLARQALLLRCQVPRRGNPRERGKRTGVSKWKRAVCRVSGRCCARGAAEGCDRKARGVRRGHGAKDSPEKTLPVLPAIVARYWTRCWQLVVLPLPLAPSSTMAWSWRPISMPR